MTTNPYMSVAMIAMMNKSELKRAGGSLALTLLPTAPGTQSALATVAVSTVASDSLRREKRVAKSVISAVEAIAAGESAATAFAAQPALKDLRPAQLTQQFEAVFNADRGSVGSFRAESASADEITTKDLWLALSQATEMLIEAIGRSKNEIFTLEQAEDYSDFLYLVPGEDRDKIVQSARNR